MNIINKWKYEWQLFILSLSIFTRLPIPAETPYSEERKNQSYKYCGLVGLVVGVLTALIYGLCTYIWSDNIAIVLSMIASVYITGAFHEDGFADTCDGFGGGYTPIRKLEIMKDSRVGAYGLIGMILILLLKYLSLMDINQVILGLILAHTLSRSLAVSFIYTHQYVRCTEDSKLNTSPSMRSTNDFITLILIASISGLFLGSLLHILSLLIILLLLRQVFSYWLIKQIGGYTGDALGAIQQVTEVICYLTFVAW